MPDKSPDYLPTTGAGTQVKSIVPAAKVIVLLRDPVDRTYSHYQNVKLRTGQEPLSFEDALEAESERELPMYGYLRWSRYIEHLPQWCEHFETLVIRSEDLYEGPKIVLGEVCEFLGVSFSNNHFAFEEKDEKRNRHSGNYKESMSQTTRQRLKEYFKPYNHRLYEYLDIDLGW